MLLTKKDIGFILKKAGLTTIAAERQLNVPEGTIAKARQGNRQLPQKWVAPLLALVNETVETYEPPQSPKRISPPIKIPAEIKHIDTLKDFHAVPRWIAKVDDFCTIHNCTPDELLECYKANKLENKPDDITDIANLMDEPKTKMY